MTLVGHLNTRDAAERWWLILLLMRALAHRVLPRAEVLSRVCFYYRIQFHHVAGLDRVGADDERYSASLGDLMVL